MIDTTISHYRVLEKLGAGGMGVVYKAQDTRLGRFVALKFLPDEYAHDVVLRERFQREARAVSALNHPNICTIHDIGEENGRLFIAMEFLDGTTLKDVIGERPVEFDRLIEIALQMVNGLEAAHAEGIIHRDIKPANIFVTRKDHVKILDFGLAKIASQKSASADETVLEISDSTKGGGTLGTIAYMSPEQALGKPLDSRTDLFSFGTTLYQMATGQMPFQGETATIVLITVIQEAPVPAARLNAAIPAELDRIIQKCLEKDRELRYQHAADIRSDLQRLKRGFDSRAHVPLPAGAQTLSDATAVGAGRSMTSGLQQSSVQQTSLQQTSVASSAEVVLPAGRASRSKSLLFAIGALAVILVAGLVWQFGFRSGGKIDSVAVLPFTNVTGDPNSEYVSEGLTEDLISNLSQSTDVAVRPRSSVARYRGKDVDTVAAARELDVAGVVSGQVTVHGDSLHVDAELMDARRNRNLWSARFDTTTQDLMTVRRQIEDGVASHLRGVASGGDQKARSAHGGSSDPEAYQLYLQGRYYWEKRTKENLDKARSYFEQAVARDPQYALAYVGLANYWSVIPDYSSVPQSEALPRAKAEAEKALSLDEELPNAHLSLSSYYSADWEWAAAEREAKRALELDPNLSDAHHVYGLLLSFTGRDKEAIEQLKRASELEPVNVQYSYNLGNGYGNARRYDEALAQWKKTLELDPNSAVTYSRMGKVNFLQGHYAEWLADWKTSATLFKNAQGLALNAIAEKAYAKGGVREAVKAIIEEQMRLRTSGAYVDPTYIAYNYAYLGDADNAFRWLDIALHERGRGLQYIKVTPELDGLHSDPRYKAVLEQLGLPE